jgi:undecaprenyl diphosphate synthase
MPHTSSTKTVPEVGAVPKHLAVIMDGVDRWHSAQSASSTSHLAPSIQAGLSAVMRTLDASLSIGVEFLTLLDFSSNSDVQSAQVLQAFLQSDLGKDLKSRGVSFKFAGDLSQLTPDLKESIAALTSVTESGDKLTLTFCAHYDGRWDIVQALNQLRRQPRFSLPISEDQLTPFLAMAHAPEPDLLVRTGGKTELSSVMTWQLAYSELYFIDTLWPDFDAAALDLAISSYQARERRFGRTSAQVVGKPSA